MDVFEADKEQLVCLPKGTFLCTVTKYLNIVPSKVICLQKVHEKWSCVSTKGFDSVFLSVDCKVKNTQDTIVVGSNSCTVTYDVSDINRDIIIVCIIMITCFCFCFCIACITLTILVLKSYKKKT